MATENTESTDNVYFVRRMNEIFIVIPAKAGIQ